MAIIESLELDFRDGMTVLTGETGAGKSIIIDAISLVLGARASSDMIRHGEDKGAIEATFNVENSPVLCRFFDELDIDFDPELMIQRILKRSGSSSVRINGVMVTVSHLRALGDMLIDIHVQHDSFRLFQPEHNYALLDNLAGGEGLLTSVNVAYQDALVNFMSAKSEYEEFLNKSRSIGDRLEFIRFQKSEIEKVGLVPEELEELEERVKIIASADQLHGLFTDILSATNDEGASLEHLYTTLEKTQSLVAIDANYNAQLMQINDIYYGLEDFVGTISAAFDKLTYEPEELESLQTRIGELRRLERKYKMSIAEIIAYYDDICKELEQFEDTDAAEARLLERVRIRHDELIAAGEKLNNGRKQVAEKVKLDLTGELQDLYLPNANFDVHFKPLACVSFLEANYNEKGIYDISFMLSTNKGEPMKELHKVASGGELSRIMLALKTILNRGQIIGTLIFDEIDTGVSGQVAAGIGAKMQEISKNKQVLCITHLPQVASQAKHHIHVSKSENNGRTATSVAYLDDEARVHELATMLSDTNVTESALLNARELLGIG